MPRNRAAFRQIVSQLPIREEEDHLKMSHQYQYQQQKKALEERPRKGTVSYFLKEMGA